MTRIIYRNIAIVSAVFILTFSIMLITNYFQVQGATSLQTEVVETLKLLNYENADNPALQEQIRQLDLLARKVYFVRHDRLITGVYILLGMLVMFLIGIRGYFAGVKDTPDKKIDFIDEWAVKTKARRYTVWSMSVLAATALVFALLSSPHLRTAKTEPETAVNNQSVEEIPEEPAILYTESSSAENVEVADTAVVTVTETETPAATELPAADTVARRQEISKITHNAFRGNNANGISSARNIPVKWDLTSGTNIVWKCDIPLKGFNSPVINGNRIFFTGADEQARELYCYDLLTGGKLWSLTAANIPGSPEKVPETTEDTGLAASSVATNGRQICAVFATGDLICADMNGKRLWAKNLGIPDNHYGYASSLVTFNSLLIVQYDNRNSRRVIAFDMATGTEQWSRNRQNDEMAWSSPIITYVNNTPQLILMGAPSITAYNPSSGEQLWRVEGLTGEVCSSACSASGIVYAASEYSKMVAINAANGTVLWESFDFLPEVASPAATKDNVYIATSYGVAAAFNTQTGELRKEHDLGGQFYSSPMIVEGRIYLFDTDGKMHIFSADSEFNLLDSFETGERTFATPAFTDGKIVVRTEKSLYCVAIK